MSNIKHISSCDLPIELPDGGRVEAFKLHVFREARPWWDLKHFSQSKTEHAVWVYGAPANNTLMRIHSECLTGDVFGAVNCDCGRQLHFALSEIVKAGSGIVLYMRGQEGRGNGLGNKVRTLSLGDVKDFDTVIAHQALGLPVENRSFDVAADIIKNYFGLKEITLLTNNPLKIDPLEKAGIKVHRRPCWVAESVHDKKYLDAKVEKMGHIAEGRVGDDEPILFWSPEHPLANFYPASIEIGSRTYSTVEHYYQAQKFVEHAEIYNEVSSSANAATAKDLSRKYQALVRSDWDSVKEEIMHDASVAKFKQHPELRQILMETGKRELIENSPDDPYWGITPDGHGMNRMGSILMRVREELRFVR